MATTHSATVRDLIAEFVTGLIDEGSVAANGVLELRTSGNSEVATLPLSNPAFGAASSGVCTADTITDDSDATGGTVDNAVLRDCNGDIIVAGSVTTSGGGGDLIITSLSVGAGDTVSCTALTYTAPN